jgi:hypothetical protein
MDYYPNIPLGHYPLPGYSIPKGTRGDLRQLVPVTYFLQIGTTGTKLLSPYFIGLQDLLKYLLSNNYKQVLRVLRAFSTLLLKIQNRY